MRGVISFAAVFMMMIMVAIFVESRGSDISPPDEGTYIIDNSDFTEEVSNLQLQYGYGNVMYTGQFGFMVYEPEPYSLTNFREAVQKHSATLCPACQFNATDTYRDVGMIGYGNYTYNETNDSANGEVRIRGQDEFLAQN